MANNSTRRAKMMIGNRLIAVVSMLNAGHDDMAANFNLYFMLDPRKLGDVPTVEIAEALEVKDVATLQVIAHELIDLAIL